MSLSISATLFDQPGVELSHWLKQADEALYTSKRKGRDRMELVPLARAAALTAPRVPWPWAGTSPAACCPP